MQAMIDLENYTKQMKVYILYVRDATNLNSIRKFAGEKRFCELRFRVLIVPALSGSAGKPITSASESPSINQPASM